MKTKYKIGVLVIMFLFSSLTTLQAQSSEGKQVFVRLKEVALLAIKSTSQSMLFQFNGPNQSGEPLINSNANTSTWLNYTSAIGVNTSNRTISAQIDHAVPGIDFIINARNSITGKGALGQSNGNVLLATSPKVILSQIGGAYTGIGPNNGHQINLEAKISDYSKLRALNNQTVTIIYTISN